MNGRRLIPILALALAAAARANMIENSSFEAPARTNDWSNTWGTFALEPWNSPPDGVYAGYIKGTWAALGNNGGVLQRVNVTPGTDYELKGKFYADNGWSAEEKHFKLEFFDSQHVLLCAFTNDLVLLLENRWTEYTIEARAPAGATHAQVVIEAAGIGGPGVLGVDDVMMNAVEPKKQPEVVAPAAPAVDEEPTEYLTEPTDSTATAK